MWSYEAMLVLYHSSPIWAKAGQKVNSFFCRRSDLRYKIVHEGET